MEEKEIERERQTRKERGRVCKYDLMGERVLSVRV
jgi:hypothetical protein